MVSSLTLSLNGLAFIALSYKSPIEILSKLSLFSLNRDINKL